MHLPNTGANYYMPLLNYYLLQNAYYSFTFSALFLNNCVFKAWCSGLVTGVIQKTGSRVCLPECRLGYDIRGIRVPG